MRAYRLKNVLSDNNGNTTINHSGGAFYYNEEDIVSIEWTNSFFCRMKLPFWNKVLFYCWLIGLSFGFYFLFIDLNYFEPIANKEGFHHHILGHLRTLFVYSLTIYFLLRVYYFNVCRDYFKKAILSIHLKNNSSIYLYDFDTSSFYEQITSGFIEYPFFVLKKNGKILEREYFNSITRQTKLFCGYLIFIIFCSIAAYSLYKNWSLLYENWPLFEPKGEKIDLPSFFIFSLGMLKVYKVISVLILVMIAVMLILLSSFVMVGSIFLSSLDRHRRSLKSILLHSCISMTMWLILLFQNYCFNLWSKWNVILIFICISQILNVFRAKNFSQRGTKIIPPNYIQFQDLFYIILPLWPLVLMLNVEISQFSFLHLNSEFLPYPFSDMIMFNNVALFVFLPAGIKEIIGSLFVKSYLNNFESISKKSMIYYFFKFLYKSSYLNAKDILKEKGVFLKYFSRQIRNHDRFVLIAVKNDGLALQFASDELRNDKEIVLEAIKSNRDAIQFASDDIKSDPEILEFLSDKTE